MRHAEAAVARETDRCGMRDVRETVEHVWGPSQRREVEADGGGWGGEGRGGVMADRAAGVSEKQRGMRMFGCF